MGADAEVNNDLVVHYVGDYRPLENVAPVPQTATCLGEYPELSAFCSEHGISLELTEESLAAVERLLATSGSIPQRTPLNDLGVFLGDTICATAPPWQWMIRHDGSAYLALGESMTWDVVEFVQREYGREGVLTAALHEMQRRASEGR